MFEMFHILFCFIMQLLGLYTKLGCQTENAVQKEVKEVKESVLNCEISHD